MRKLLQNKLFNTVFVVVIVLIGFYLVYLRDDVLVLQEEPQLQSPLVIMKPFDIKNFTLPVNGKAITLVNNGAITASLTSPTTTTRYFGNVATGDLNADDYTDIALLVTQKVEGFPTVKYYTVVVLIIDGGYIPLNAMYIGDDIAPQSTIITDGKLEVNYLIKKTIATSTAQVKAIRRYEVSVDKKLVESISQPQ